ncbi:MAG: efflux RND transporter periplasmic adaptor subunit, partial [Oscillospiraceae bacterium]|nr:efflux RND transporter periplasmic adaptor subunit [Oscillospiraceae bacterium]
MTEQKVKKRDWVKNAAIIFLALMLVLTFFSNTIMNRSLPEVAAEYVQSGVISARIRGTGTVAANESYEVKSLQTREVLSVPVKVGDKVSIGDPLVFYSAAESAQLKEGEAALDALVLAYKKALINSTDGDYAKENRDIQLAQEALDQAKADRDASYVAAAELAAAQGNCSRAKTEADLQQTRVSSLEDQLASLNPGSENSAAINAKRSEVSAAKAKLDAARAVHSAAYGNLESCTVEWMRQLGQVSGDKVSYMEMLNETYAALLNAYDEPSFPTSEAAAGIPAFPTGVGYSRASITAMTAAYAAVDPLQKNYDSLSSELARLIDESSGDYNYNTVKNQLAAAKNTLAAAQVALAGYESALKALEDKQATYNAALEAVSTNQKALQDLMFALAEQKKADGKTQATEALDLEAQRKQIEEQTKALAELKAGG